MPLELKQLMPLIEASPLLDQVEAALRKLGKKETADMLLHLQQDAGCDAQTAFGSFDDVAGTKTARLIQDYEEVTAERFNGTLQDVHAALAPRNPREAMALGDLRRTYGMLIEKLYVNDPSLARKSPPPPAMGL